MLPQHPAGGRSRPGHAAEEAARRAVRGDPREHEGDRTHGDAGRASSPRWKARASQSPQTFDRVLVSVGRRPNGKGIGLEKTKAKVDRPRVHRGRCAAAHGRSAAVCHRRRGRRADAGPQGDARRRRWRSRRSSGEPAAFDSVAIPAVVFTDPEIAWCGLTETQAEGEEPRRQSRPLSRGRRPAAPRRSRRTEGLTKMIFDAGDRPRAGRRDRAAPARAS